MKIIEVNPDIKALVDDNNGYCPCAVVKNEDTKCMCREFKPLSEYGKRMRRGKNIGQAYCIPCKRIIDRNNKRTKREMEKL